MYWLNRRSRPNPADTVVVLLRSGEVMLKYFRDDYGDEIAMDSHNHGFTLKSVKKADIVFIHQVSGMFYRRKIKHECKLRSVP